MAIKWKNSKFFSFSSVMVSLIAAVVFVSLFPFFSRKAKENFTDPLTNQAFIEDLLSVNYIQYRYLKENSDQMKYSCSDLFLDISVTGSLPLQEKKDGTVYLDDFFANERLQYLISQQRDFLEMQFSECENRLSVLGERMDYFIEDTETGNCLSNCGDSLPEAVRLDSSGDASQEYIYYLSVEYDNAGNIKNTAVRSPDESRQFLSRVQNAGHTIPFTLNPDEADITDAAGSLYYSLEDSNSENSATLQLSVTAPKNMRVIYGLTSQQYSDLINDTVQISYKTNDGLTVLWEDFSSARLESYYQAGVSNSYLLILGCCALLGFLIYRRGTGNKLPVSQDNHPEAEKKEDDFFQRLSLETFAVIMICLLSFSVLVNRYVYEYINGLFLRNLRAGLINGGKLFFLSVDKIVIFFFLFFLFFTGFSSGRILSNLRTDNFREKSLIFRYWRKAYTRIRKIILDFYRDLVLYDIGTDANRIILKVLGVNFIILLIICCFWFAGIFGLIVYTVIVYFILKKYVISIQEKYRRLLNATSSIAQGNLDTALSEDFGIFESYKTQLRQIQSDFKRAVDEEVRSQKMKSELITNVSHDLKTPLTAIITYIDLLGEPGLSEEKKREYLEVLRKKSNRLKILIEDLFEISKASSRSVTLQIMDVDLCNLIRQACLELEDRIEAAGLDFRFDLPAEKTILPLDSQKTYRIFDNLFSNIIKYALPGTRVYISLKDYGCYAEAELKNISASEISMDPNDLTERFVRGDGSRNTEGSGLGLAIVKSFTELQGGTMRIETDGDLFKVYLQFFRPGPKDDDIEGNQQQDQENAGYSGSPASQNLQNRQSCPPPFKYPNPGTMPQDRKKRTNKERRQDVPKRKLRRN